LQYVKELSFSFANSSSSPLFVISFFTLFPLFRGCKGKQKFSFTKFIFVFLEKKICDFLFSLCLFVKNYAVFLSFLIKQPGCKGKDIFRTTKFIFQKLSKIGAYR